MKTYNRVAAWSATALTLALTAGPLSAQSQQNQNQTGVQQDQTTTQGSGATQLTADQQNGQNTQNQQQYGQQDQNNQNTQSTVDQQNKANQQNKADMQSQSQQTGRQYNNATASTGATPTRYNKASGIVGMDVRNQNNENLGHIKDVVFDLNNERVSYAVIGASSTGFLGMNEKLLAVPLSALKPSDDQKYLVLNADKSKVEAAAGFDRNSWPSVGSPSWGAQPFWQDNSSQNYNQDNNNQKNTQGNDTSKDMIK